MQIQTKLSRQVPISRFKSSRTTEAGAFPIGARSDAPSTNMRNVQSSVIPEHNSSVGQVQQSAVNPLCVKNDARGPLGAHRSRT